MIISVNFYASVILSHNYTCHFDFHYDFPDDKRVTNIMNVLHIDVAKVLIWLSHIRSNEKIRTGFNQKINVQYVVSVHTLFCA